VYGCVGVWVYECMGVWVCMRVWVCGCMGVWVYECMDVWVYELYGCVGVCVCVWVRMAKVFGWNYPMLTHIYSPYGEFIPGGDAVSLREVRPIRYSTRVWLAPGVAV